MMALGWWGYWGSEGSKALNSGLFYSLNADSFLI